MRYRRVTHRKRSAICTLHSTRPKIRPCSELLKRKRQTRNLKECATKIYKRNSGTRCYILQPTSAPRQADRAIRGTPESTGKGVDFAIRREIC